MESVLDERCHLRMYLSCMRGSMPYRRFMPGYSDRQDSLTVDFTSVHELMSDISERCLHKVCISC